MHRSSSVCLQLLRHTISTQSEHNGNISLESLLYGSNEWLSFLGSRTLHFIIPSNRNSQGDSLHRHTLSGTYMELAVLRNVGVQTHNSHITDFFPCWFL